VISIMVSGTANAAAVIPPTLIARADEVIE
jgi:hypothetical protein